MKTPKNKSASLVPEKNPMKAAFDLMPKKAKPSLQDKPVKAPKAPKVAKAPAKPFKNPIKKGKN